MNIAKNRTLSPIVKFLAFTEAALIYAFIYNPWTKFPYTLLIVIITILTLTYFRERSLASIGLKNNYSVGKVLLTALFAFIALETAMDFIIQPLVNKICHEVPDYSGFSKLTHDTGRYFKYIFYVWISAAIGEEMLFRGYLFERFEKLLPRFKYKTTVIVVLTAILFSAPHFYQGTAGLVMTFLFGLAFGFIYLKNNCNLWVNIIVHGFVDSLFLTLAYTDNLSYYEVINKLVLGY
ncbi:MAG: CPBP family intramembrane metalloprotease [Sphingobacteriaceae bacterium]|nr:MAG: CPBP family intramembrane metalloprotease [Sphingobacteriaceae bacterium]